MTDEVLEPTESTDGQKSSMDALQESINSMIAGESASSAGPQAAGVTEEKPATPLGGSAINLLMDVNLLFTVELGRTQMPIKHVLELQKGSVVELDRVAGEPVDVYVNEHLMARGEVVVVDDKFGVRITELIAPETKE
ncbi:flagellar motor switch protein FliN [Leptolinea sp. HRD-7]|jgi:flagellar motor switch protein FliN/FliY|nr:flagellar motor switch protein FliN [Leptolinea sp. HRD-7]